MRTRYSILACFGLAFLYSITPLYAVNEVVSVVGSASADGHPLRAGSEVAEGATIRTKANSAVKLILSSGDILDVGPDSDIKLPSRSQKTGSTYSVQVRYGNVRAVLEGRERATTRGRPDRLLLVPSSGNGATVAAVRGARATKSDLIVQKNGTTNRTRGEVARTPAALPSVPALPTIPLATLDRLSEPLTRPLGGDPSRSPGSERPSEGAPNTSTPTASEGDKLKTLSQPAEVFFSSGLPASNQDRYNALPVAGGGGSGGGAAAAAGTGVGIGPGGDTTVWAPVLTPVPGPVFTPNPDPGPQQTPVPSPI